MMNLCSTGSCSFTCSMYVFIGSSQVIKEPCIAFGILFV
jgi:hypothetical protein